MIYYLQMSAETKESFGKRITRRLKEIGKPKTYHGMWEDLTLVAASIIPQNSIQNVEAISTFEISEGTPQEALERLLKVRNMDQIAGLIVRKYGHENSIKEKYDDASQLTERLSELLKTRE